MSRPKLRNWTAVAAFQRGGAGKHKNKALKGSGRKGYRHPKHKNKDDNRARRH
jgi:hypothetical protein